MLYLHCPSCDTALQIEEKMLSVKDGFIRCGHCRKKFNAAQQQTDNQPDISTSKSNVESAQEDLVVDWEKPTQKPAVKRPYGTLSIILFITFIYQLIAFNTDQLTQTPELQPFFQRLNQAFSLSIPPYQNPNEIEVIERALSPLNDKPNIMAFDLSFKNSALADQPYPTIHLNLTDATGKTIAHTAFEKTHYLAENESYDLFPSQAIKTVRLFFNTPKGKPLGFHIHFE